MPGLHSRGWTVAGVLASRAELELELRRERRAAAREALHRPGNIDLARSPSQISSAPSNRNKMKFARRPNAPSQRWLL